MFWANAFSVSQSANSSRNAAVPIARFASARRVDEGIWRFIFMTRSDVYCGGCNWVLAIVVLSTLLRIRIRRSGEPLLPFLQINVMLGLGKLGHHPDGQDEHLLHVKQDAVCNPMANHCSPRSRTTGLDA